MVNFSMLRDSKSPEFQHENDYATFHTFLGYIILFRCGLSFITSKVLSTAFGEVWLSAPLPPPRSDDSAYAPGSYLLSSASGWPFPYLITSLRHCLWVALVRIYYYELQFFCFRDRFQTLFIPIVFPTNTLRSSKSCKVALYMKKSRPRLKSHSPTRATLGESTFPTFPYRNLAFYYTRNKQWARIDPFFDGKVTFLAKPTFLQVNTWLDQPDHY